MSIARAIEEEGGDHPFIVILRILQQTKTDLLEIALTTCTAGVFSRPCKSWEEDGREDCNNRNDDQEFDEGEAAFYTHRTPATV